MKEGTVAFQVTKVQEIFFVTSAFVDMLICESSIHVSFISN